MAPYTPLRSRQSISKTFFPTYFGALKTQVYHDPSTTRGGASNGYVMALLRKDCSIVFHEAWHGLLIAKDRLASSLPMPQWHFGV